MSFGRLILRPKQGEPQPTEPARTPLKITVKPKEPAAEVPQRAPLKLLVKPKATTPQPATESPEVAAFKRRAQELRDRVAARGYTTQTRLEPRLPLRSIKPKVVARPRPPR